MMIKKAILAILPIIVAAQLPFSFVNVLPPEWIKNVEYGLKWTELLMNGYPGVTGSQKPSRVSEPSAITEQIPKGRVTTTVVIAQPLPELYHVAELKKLHIQFEKELCDAKTYERIQMQVKKALEIEHEIRLIQLQRIRNIQL